MIKGYGNRHKAYAEVCTLFNAEHADNESITQIIVINKYYRLN